MNRLFIILLISCLLCYYCDNSTAPQDIQSVNEYIHNENISADEFWAADKFHIVSSDIYINNAIVTIQAGALVKLNAGASINVMNSSGLHADGTDAAILFTRADQQQGNWDYIFFADHSIDTNCTFINCTFEYGGADQNWPTTIYCQKSMPSIINCKISNSASNGIYLDGNCSSITFTDNIITECVGAPIATAAINVPIMNNNGDYTGNESDCIKIIDGTINEDMIWQNFILPYHIADDIIIQNAKLTISSGSILKFESRYGLKVLDTGTLIAEGNGEQIVFSAVKQSKGFWKALIFENFSTGTLENCVIEYGGYDYQYPANIFYDHSSIKIHNCIVRNGSRYGVYIKGELIPDAFINNTIENNNGAPLSTGTINVSNLRGNLILYNGENHIEVRGGVIEGEINRRSDWYNLGLPYRIVGDIYIRSAILNIDPGVTVEIDNNSQINVMEGGELYADGSSSLITFTGIYKIHGSWNCINFNRLCHDWNCILKHCRIEYGGGSNIMPANIYCDDVSPTITNCYIENSLNYGIKLEGTYPSHIRDNYLNNNFFNNNIRGNIFP
jgi:hypothetical protein